VFEDFKVPTKNTNSKKLLL